MIANVLLIKKNVKTEELVKSIKNLYLEHPKTSIRKATNSIRASYSTIQNITRKVLKIKPYKEPRSFKLYSGDYVKRLKFASYVKSKRINLEKQFICSDEAYFYLHGGHNSQNNRIWSEYGPTEPSEQPLNDEKLMVLCTFSANKVYGPYFFEKKCKLNELFRLSQKIFLADA